MPRFCLMIENTNPNRSSGEALILSKWISWPVKPGIGEKFNLEAIVYADDDEDDIVHHEVKAVEHQFVPRTLWEKCILGKQECVVAIVFHSDDPRVFSKPARGWTVRV